VNRERILRLIAETCLTRDGRERLSDLAAWLDEHGVEGEDRDALLATGGRLGVYRTLVRNNLGGVTFRVLARTRRLVNAAARDAFDDGFVAFLHERGPRSPLLRDLPREVVEFLAVRWRGDEGVPAWATELADYELARFEADAAPPTPTASTAAVAEVHLGSHFSPADGAKLVRYAFAVHHVSDDEDDFAAPPLDETHLLVSRDPDGHVHTTSLEPIGFHVVANLFSGQPLGEAVRAAAGREGAALTPSLLEETAHTLAELAAAGAFSA
jgi:hypothetical protein